MISASGHLFNEEDYVLNHDMFKAEDLIHYVLEYEQNMNSLSCTII
jgi:hypothetical protein